MTLTCTDNQVRFRFKNHNFLLLHPQKDVWRLLSEKNGTFDLNGAAQTIAADLGETVDAQALPVELDAQKGRVCAADGSFAEVRYDVIRFFDTCGICKRTVTDVRNTKDGIAVRLALSETERIYGTGERFNRVDQRGKRIHIYGIDRWCWKEGNSYIPIPFLFSSECSAVFFNRYEHALMDLGRTHRKAMTVTQKYAPLDMYIFTAQTPREILTAYCKLTGFAPMPCDWAFGTLVCRYHPEFSTKDGVMAMADAMEKNGFPWEAIIMEGWKTYDSARWDALKEISDILHAKGKKVMVYEQCGRFPKSGDAFGLTDDHAVQSTSGTLLKETRSVNLLDNLSNHTMRCYDLTKPAAAEKWREIWGRIIHEVGVDGAKIDFCEQFPDSPDIRFADGRDPLAAHHWYPTYYNILSYRDFNTRPDGGLNFSRGSGIGGQRAPFVWAGDQRREFNFLGAVVKAALSLGFSGFPFVSWDMAGYRPSFLPLDKLRENEVFMRAVEFTAFSPTVQTHGNVTRPYDFDAHTKDVYRAYTCLHDALRPYIRQQAQIACKTGLPMMRHLFLYDHTDENVYGIEDEYLFGEALLAAPVLKNARKRNIYLPKGQWVNIFTGEAFDGGQTLKNYRVPLEAVPVFKNINADTSVLDAALENGRKYIEDIVKLSAI